MELAVQRGHNAQHNTTHPFSEWAFPHFSELTSAELVLRVYLEFLKILKVPLTKHRLFKARDDSMTTNNKRGGNKTVSKNFKDVLQS